MPFEKALIDPGLGGGGNQQDTVNFPPVAGVGLKDKLKTLTFWIEIPADPVPGPV